MLISPPTFVQYTDRTLLDNPRARAVITDLLTVAYPYPTLDRGVSMIKFVQSETERVYDCRAGLREAKALVDEYLKPFLNPHKGSIDCLDEAIQRLAVLADCEGRSSEELRVIRELCRDARGPLTCFEVA